MSSPEGRGQSVLSWSNPGTENGAWCTAVPGWKLLGLSRQHSVVAGLRGRNGAGVGSETVRQTCLYRVGLEVGPNLQLVCLITMMKSVKLVLGS